MSREVYDMHDCEHPLLTVSFQSKGYQGTFDSGIAPYGLVMPASAWLCRIIYERKTLKVGPGLWGWVPAMSLPPYCPVCLRKVFVNLVGKERKQQLDTFIWPFQAEVADSEGQALMQLMAACAYAPSPVMLDVTDGITHTLYTVEGKEVIKWQEINSAQASSKSISMGWIDRPVCAVGGLGCRTVWVCGYDTSCRWYFLRVQNSMSETHGAAACYVSQAACN